MVDAFLVSCWMLFQKNPYQQHVFLTSANRAQLVQACDHILQKWRSYTNPDVGIYARTEDTPHNTITPIARMRNGRLECDLVLRNNRTSPERPLGIFHPNPSLHHIKKENIGLIEVMGLAVLPARLAVELPHGFLRVSGSSVKASVKSLCTAVGKC